MAKDEQIWCEEIEEMLCAPKGTTRDMDFLKECQIDAWDAYHFLTYMNGEWPGELRPWEATDE